MSDVPRVIVGAHDSLTGLRALRVAVSAARERRVELRVVRAYQPPPRPADQWGTAMFGARPPQDPWRAANARAVDLIEAAFGAAMGGPPEDLPVRFATGPGPARHLLVDTIVNEGDLLVVGASGRGHWWLPFRRSTSRYCAARVSCPVLVVPPASATRQLRRGEPLIADGALASRAPTWFTGPERRSRARSGRPEHARRRTGHPP
jgi:nucleotide-binding universal stress UspA family protein